MTDLKKLRELAAKADKGPWRWLNCRTLVGDYDSRPVILTSNDFLEVRNRKTGLLELASVDGPNESFIAAANPETVIALLDRIEKLERIAQDFASHCDDCALLYSYDDENVKCNCGLQLALEKAEVP